VQLKGIIDFPNLIKKIRKKHSLIYFLENFNFCFLVLCQFRENAILGCKSNVANHTMGAFKRITDNGSNWLLESN
jgi:hypothetical protein